MPFSVNFAKFLATLFFTIHLWVTASRPKIMFIDFLIVEQIFLSPQVKRSMINSNKLINLYIQVAEGLENLEISGKFQKFIELLASA